MKDVTLNQKEQARISVLSSVLEYQVPIADAAELLDVSPRHARRMLAAHRERGAAALPTATVLTTPLRPARLLQWCN